MRLGFWLDFLEDFRLLIARYSFGGGCDTG
jgi:hypothetical protein